MYSFDIQIKLVKFLFAANTDNSKHQKLPRKYHQINLINQLKVNLFLQVNKT